MPCTVFLVYPWYRVPLQPLPVGALSYKARHDSSVTQAGRHGRLVVCLLLSTEDLEIIKVRHHSNAALF